MKVYAVINATIPIEIPDKYKEICGLDPMKDCDHDELRDEFWEKLYGILSEVTGLTSDECECERIVDEHGWTLIS